jgi:proteasome lid subunit RPN8/RPN11
MLTIPRAIYDQVIAHLQNAYPKEGCGILGGQEDRATKWYPMTNTEASPVSYMMNPREQLQVMKKMREDKVEMVAIVHSHVASPAYPSSHDVAMAFYDVGYVIVSLADRAKPEAKSFLIRDGKISEDGVEIV